MIVGTAGISSAPGLEHVEIATQGCGNATFGPAGRSPPGSRKRPTTARAYSCRIVDQLPYDAVASLAVPSTTEFPLAHDAGVHFLDPELGRGRIAVVVSPDREGPRTTLIVELADWAVACPLTTGQLHRLTNGLAGRGRRNAIRPLSVDEEHVHITGTPTLMVVEAGERIAQIPAGPKRSLSKALRAFEQKPLLG